MGGYIAFTVRRSITRFPHALDALRSHVYFKPVALGGIEGHDSGDHLFVSGYALEDFVNRFGKDAPAKPVSIEVAPGKSPVNLDYLKQIAQDAGSGHVLSALSPFERLCNDEGMTYLQEGSLCEAEITKCARWFDDHSDAVLYIYGTVDLSSETKKATYWSRAFRETVSTTEIGPPFALLRIGKAPLEKSQMELRIFSQSTVWVEDGNLQRLVSLAQSLVLWEKCSVVSTSLDVEGSPFAPHKDSIRAAFSGPLSLQLGS